MISSQKLILVSLVINILMGMVHGLYMGNGEYDHSILNSDINYLEDYESQHRIVTGKPI